MSWTREPILKRISALSFANGPSRHPSQLTAVRSSDNHGLERHGSAVGANQDAARADILRGAGVPISFISRPVPHRNGEVESLRPVGAIVSSALDDKVVDAAAKQARASGVKWVTFGATIPDQDATLGFPHEKAGEILKHLSDAEVQTLSAEMASMRKLSADTASAVMDELVITVSADEQAGVWTEAFGAY